MIWLQNLIDSATIPAVTAFLLGLLTALSPCPMATNITAIGFIGRDLSNHHRLFIRGLLYTLGRVVTYVGIALILIPLLRQGASVYAIERVIATYGELIIAPSLILIGLFLLFGHKLNLAKFGFSTSRIDTNRRRGAWGSLLLGVLFALAFCPSSAVIYFGMLMPMAAVEAGSYALPLIYAVATGLPVVVVAWILAYGVDRIGRFYNKMQIIQRWTNWIIGSLFIAGGIYYLIILYL